MPKVDVWPGERCANNDEGAVESRTSRAIELLRSLADRLSRLMRTTYLVACRSDELARGTSKASRIALTGADDLVSPSVPPAAQSTGGLIWASKHSERIRHWKASLGRPLD